MGALPRPALDGFGGRDRDDQQQQQWLTGLLAAMFPRYVERRQLPWLEHPLGAAIMSAERGPMTMAVAARIRHLMSTERGRRDSQCAWASWDSSREFHFLRLHVDILKRLIRARAAYSIDDLTELLEIAADVGIPVGAILGHLERLAVESLPARTRAALEATRIHNNDALETRRRVLLGAARAPERDVAIAPTSAWARAAIETIAASPDADAWAALVAHAATLRQPQPSARWRGELDELEAAVRGAESEIERWLALSHVAAAQRGEGDDDNGDDRGDSGDNDSGDNDSGDNDSDNDDNDDILRGLLWTLPAGADAARTRAVSDVVSSSRAGVAAIAALAAIGSDDAIRLLFAHTYADGSKVVSRNAHKALAAVAAAQSISVAELERRVGAREHARRDEAPAAGTLRDAIFADPFSDELRAIWADELSEAGDARGEFITLQLLEAPTKTQKARADALLKSRAREWLGPFAGVLQRRGLRFERGFPVAGRLEPDCGDALRPLIGDGAWSTFLELDVNSRGSVLAEFLTSEALHRSLRALVGLSAEDLGALLEGPPRALTRLGLKWVGEHNVGTLARLAATTHPLPALASLVFEGIDGAPSDVPGLLDAPLFANVEHLDIGPRAAGPWLALMASRPTLSRLDIRPDYNQSWHYAAVRTPSGIELRATSKGTRGTEEVLGEVLAAIEAVPAAALARLAISHSGPWERTAEQLAPLVRYCESLSLERLSLPKPKRGS